MGRLGLVDRRLVARYLAPAVFLLAVTAVVLVVRSAVRSSPSKPRGTTAVTTRAPSTRARPKPPSPAKRYYVIRSGDTLEAIASRLRTSVARLLQLNPGIQPTTLRPGEQIRVR